MAGEHKKSMRLGSMFSEIIPLASFFIVNQSHGLYIGALAALLTVNFLLKTSTRSEARAVSRSKKVANKSATSKF